jgi:hypothetical protein
METEMGREMDMGRKMETEMGRDMELGRKMETDRGGRWSWGGRWRRI